jgi:hypothetical protein
MLEKAGFSLGRIIWDEGGRGEEEDDLAPFLFRLLNVFSMYYTSNLTVCVCICLPAVCGFLKPCDTHPHTI